MPDYRVQTDVYHGPMDLLLYLIKRDEIDLYDIPIARITEQYCRYVEMLKVIDPNIAGDFLVMATVLMELKSRMLLPRPVSEEGEAEELIDPRLELVRQLLEYKKFKDASFELREAAEQQSRRWPRVPARLGAGPGGEEDTRQIDLEYVQIWDLVAAFNKIMSAIGAGQAVHDVILDDTPMALHAQDILDRLQRKGGELLFEQLFAGQTRAEMIGLFLALLELMRQARIRVVQESPEGRIVVHLLSAEPIEIGEAWGPAFRDAVLGSEETPAVERGTDRETTAPETEAGESTGTPDTAEPGARDTKAEDNAATGGPARAQDQDEDSHRPEEHAAP